MSPVKDITELQSALEQNPGDRQAFEALEDELLQAQRWEDLVRLYRRQGELVDEIPEFWERCISRLDQLAAACEEPPERADVLIQIGVI